MINYENSNHWQSMMERERVINNLFSIRKNYVGICDNEIPFESTDGSFWRKIVNKFLLIHSCDALSGLSGNKVMVGLHGAVSMYAGY